jgi:undecaprenyl-diphosphatase
MDANKPENEIAQPTLVRLWPLIVGILLAAGSILIFRWFAGEVNEGDTSIVDDSIRNYFHSFASPLLTRFMLAVSFTGTVRFLVVLGLIVLVTMLYLKERRAAAIFLITMAGEIVLELTLKASYERARPEPFLKLPVPATYSFPSGHAMGSFCFYGILAWILIRRIDSLPLRIAIAVAASVWILLIGLSRIYLGVHYASDVVAGYMAGLIWTAAVVFTDWYIRHRNDRQRSKSK